MKKTPKDLEKLLEYVNSRNVQLNKYLKRITTAADIQKHVTMHTARHSFAYLADQHGIGVSVIQNLLDHGKLETTERYIRSLRRSDELDQAVEGMWE